MSKKIENLKDLNYLQNITYLSETLLEASKKSDSEKLQKMIKATTEIAFYVNTLQMDRWAYNTSIRDYRLERNRAIERARRSEKKLKKIDNSFG